MRMCARVPGVLIIVCGVAIATLESQSSIGREVAMAHHLQDGEEFSLPLSELVAHGRRLFTAVWTIEEGGGRPLRRGRIGADGVRRAESVRAGLGHRILEDPAGS